MTQSMAPPYNWLTSHSWQSQLPSELHEMFDRLQVQGCSIIRVGIEGTHAPIIHVYVSQFFDPATVVEDNPTTAGLFVLPDGKGVGSRNHYLSIHYDPSIQPYG
jgi:hypothetical protein